jgi:hypothetical protein
LNSEKDKGQRDGEKKPVGSQEDNQTEQTSKRSRLNTTKIDHGKSKSNEMST